MPRNARINQQTAMPEPGTRILILGGARSGKSRYALRLAERRWQHPLYLATAEAQDAEMARRIAAHHRARGPHWRCIEEPLEIAAILKNRAVKADGILVDCLTLWLSNVLLKEGPGAYARRRQALLAAVRKMRRNLILVSNEVGLGIVPEHELGRTFRDLAGWLNQDLAAAADTVVLVTAGLPLALKGTLPEARD